MIKTLFTSFLILFISYTLSAQEVILKKGLRITKLIKIKKGIYKLDASQNISQSVIVIEGNNITVDFNNAVLQGSNLKKNPDEFFGVAVIIKKGRNITIKNLNAKGYKVALVAKNIDGLKIENCNFSYNYRQHLNSTQEKEDISDWMSYHQNEKDEWLRYGAAMYLRNCKNITISNNIVTGGQNALMMMECTNGLIFNNNFSFNSGIGIGMYKSSFNTVMYNKINFNVRGYSHGIYNRGQDSAGILVYEQSNNNLFYKNSVTHGGDGFFLWAGQTTMDTGKGGCNDNILFGNDFSYAPTNGIEVTFSRNKILKNRIFECDHGIWGGYSYDTKISDNRFRNNRIGIAIEHGQNNRIHHNLFLKEKEAIKLWARKEQPSDWGYAKYRDTRSHNYIIALNSFNEHDVALNIIRSDSLQIFSNTYSNVELELKVDSTVGYIDSLSKEDLLYELSEEDSIEIPHIKNPSDPFRGGGKLAGRKNIIMTEWGPYDFGYPIIWNTNPADTSDIMKFDVFGPKGRWKIISAKGVEISSTIVDTFPTSFTAKKIKGDRTDIEIVAEYKGAAFTDQFGNKVPANKPNRIIYSKFFQPIPFVVNWYAFDSSITSLPKKDFVADVTSQQPFKTERTDKINYAWWGGIKVKDQQHKQFLTVAEGSATFLPGNYEISLTWDDAVRVYIDGKLLVDEWNPSKYKFDESPHRKIKVPLNGNHHFKLEHVELGGFATLSMKVKKLKGL